MSEVYLKVVDPTSRMDVETLYALLQERTPEQSISHKEMPTRQEHWHFVKSRPYKGWFLLVCGAQFVGSVYITGANELGIFIFANQRGKGYAKSAIHQMMVHYDGPFYANINPENNPSQKFFIEMGFELIQQTYKLGD